LLVNVTNKDEMNNLCKMTGSKTMDENKISYEKTNTAQKPRCALNVFITEELLDSCPFWIIDLPWSPENPTPSKRHMSGSDHMKERGEYPVWWIIGVLTTVTRLQYIHPSNVF